MSRVRSHAETINGAAQQVLVRGRDGEYHPNETIPRDQMASFVTNLLTAVESGGVAPHAAQQETFAGDDGGGGDGDSLPADSTDVGLAVTAALVLPGAAVAGSAAPASRLEGRRRRCSTAPPAHRGPPVRRPWAPRAPVMRRLGGLWVG